MIGAGLTAGSTLAGTNKQHHACLNKQEGDFSAGIDHKGGGGGAIGAHLASAGDKQRDSG